MGKTLKTTQGAYLVSDELFECIENVLLPMLQDQAQTGELERNRGSRNNGDSTNSTLSIEVIGFLACLFRRLEDHQLTRLASNSKCLDVLSDFTFFVFSSDATLSRSHYLRQSCLSAILSFSSLPSLLSLASSDTICHMIRLLVQIIGSFQNAFANFADGNSFTYKDRSSYKWAALCLRNLTRTVVVYENPNQSWIWGDHWLYMNDIEWLLDFLNDDEKAIQKFGLGILANLILVYAFCY